MNFKSIILIKETTQLFIEVTIISASYTVADFFCRENHECYNRLSVFSKLAKLRCWVSRCLQYLIWVSQQQPLRVSVDKDGLKFDAIFRHIFKGKNRCYFYNSKFQVNISLRNANANVFFYRTTDSKNNFLSNCQIIPTHLKRNILNANKADKLLKEIQYFWNRSNIRILWFIWNYVP